ncbi:MAG: helix-turn-helix transcriptional regulator [Phycisphaerae bacterium]|nr:helix-turn-helix transcriptional regulator [Gemmatimonadaceae bacterium]
MECPVARSMAEVGDAWRVLIIRDALLGFRRFDEFESNLGIAPNILTQRLTALVADGLLLKRPYQQRPVRYEYVPTPKAREFGVVIAALASWGTRWLLPDGATITLVDRESGEPLDVSMIGTTTRIACSADNLQFLPGPKAGPETLKRVARLNARQEK